MGTNAVQRLTFDPAADVRPSWSRDGKFIYFSSNRTGRHQIWKVPAGGGEPKQITREGGAYALETVDGRELYYVTADQPAAIRLMPVNGGEERTVIDRAVGYASLAMGVDGLYYLASLTATSARLEVFDFAMPEEPPGAVDRSASAPLSFKPAGRTVGAVYAKSTAKRATPMLQRLK